MGCVCQDNVGTEALSSWLVGTDANQRGQECVRASAVWRWESEGEGGVLEMEGARQCGRGGRQLPERAGPGVPARPVPTGLGSEGRGFLPAASRFTLYIL